MIYGAMVIYCSSITGHFFVFWFTYHTAVVLLKFSSSRVKALGRLLWKILSGLFCRGTLAIYLSLPIVKVCEQWCCLILPIGYIVHGNWLRVIPQLFFWKKKKRKSLYSGFSSPMTKRLKSRSQFKACYYLWVKSILLEFEWLQCIPKLWDLMHLFIYSHLICVSLWEMQNLKSVNWFFWGEVLYLLIFGRK